jgi:RNA polymerase sigma factor (sigma-70 family)
VAYVVKVVIAGSLDRGAFWTSMFGAANDFRQAGEAVIQIRARSEWIGVGQPGSTTTAVRIRSVGGNLPDRWDELAVARLVAGDDTALASVYDQYGGYVYSLALRVTRDRSTAEDITQEVFCHLWTKATDFNGERGSLRAWLGMLAHRRSVDRVRREEARRARERRDLEQSVTALPDVAEGAMNVVVTERVRVALSELPDEQRRCVEMAYFGGKTFREVAAALGIAEGTAKSRIRLALAKLANALEGAVR